MIIKIETKETEYYQYEKIIYIYNIVRYYRLEPSENMYDKEKFNSFAKKRISEKEWSEI